MNRTELADRLSISETLSVYCASIDRRDMTALAAVFTADVQLDMGNGAVFTGRERVLQLVRDVTAQWEATHHQCTNHLIAGYDGHAASVSSYVHAFHDSPAQDRTMHLWGYYADEFVRRDDAWCIRVRRLRVAGVATTGSSPFPERFERLTGPR